MGKEQIAAAELIMNIMLGKTGEVGRVDFFPQKGKFPERMGQEQPFARATPESQGIESGRLGRMIRQLDASPQVDMHQLMVLRHGKVICECAFAPYRREMWHVTHSMCKSITGMAVGMLAEEGKLSLEENIYDIFSYKVNYSLLNTFSKILRPRVTVEHLLTMTSGVQFNETGIVSGNDWLEGYMNAPVSGKPGEQFQYNSMNTYVLSAIVTERTGLTLEEYLRPRLFAPMGITRYLWETCPQGITKGGWGLFLCPEDMAKLGQLYLQKGNWRGRQLVPREWVEASVQKHVDTDEGTYGYGYQLWMEQRPGSFEFNGMLGQNVVVYPDMDMVVVTNAGNNELFQDCVMLNMIRGCFPPEYRPAERLPENPAEYRLLRELTGRLEQGSPAAPELRSGGWSAGRRRSPSGAAGRRRGRIQRRAWAPEEIGRDRAFARESAGEPEAVRAALSESGAELLQTAQTAGAEQITPDVSLADSGVLRALADWNRWMGENEPGQDGAEETRERAAAEGDLERISKEESTDRAAESGEPGSVGTEEPGTGCKARPQRSPGISLEKSDGSTAGYRGFLNRLDGRCYEIRPQSVGLYPLFIQVFHNNRTDGIRSVAFSCRRGALSVLFQEGEEWQEIPVGFGSAKERWLTLHEESYLIASQGTLSRDERGDVVLKLEMTYLEEAVRRLVYIFFREDGRRIELRWYETPGKRLILEGLEAIMETATNNVFFSALADKGGTELLHRLVEQTIEPVVQGAEVYNRIDMRDEKQQDRP